MTTIDHNSGTILQLPDLTPEEANRSILSKYDQSRCDELIKFMSHPGRTKAQVCAYWGISFTTLEKWVRTYPEFQQAMDIAMVKAEAEYTQKVWEMATTKTEGNIGALIFFGCNVFRKSFAQKNDNNTNVTINNVTNMTPAERKERLAQYRDKLLEKDTNDQ